VGLVPVSFAAQVGFQNAGAVILTNLTEAPRSLATALTMPRRFPLAARNLRCFVIFDPPRHGVRWVGNSTCADRPRQYPRRSAFSAAIISRAAGVGKGWHRHAGCNQIAKLGDATPEQDVHCSLTGVWRWGQRIPHPLKFLAGLVTREGDSRVYPGRRSKKYIPMV
jgi:hypothetical protein